MTYLFSQKYGTFKWKPSRNMLTASFAHFGTFGHGDTISMKRRAAASGITPLPARLMASGTNCIAAASSRDAMGSRRGNSLIEFSLLFPWYVFLFVGILDFGFYSYALIATQSAARVAAVYCSASSSTASDSATACGYALDQLRGMPNVGMALSTCVGPPLTLTASLVSGSDTPDGLNAARVTVIYVTPQLIPIPGVLPGQLSITSSVLMRTRS
jgi:Flp pilus assembly protein TadG